jgi:hypothetical protein
MRDQRPTICPLRQIMRVQDMEGIDEQNSSLVVIDLSVGIMSNREKDSLVPCVTRIHVDAKPIL